MKTGQPASDTQQQSARFADLARKLECDEDEAAFDAKLREVAKHKQGNRGDTDSPVGK